MKTLRLASVGSTNVHARELVAGGERGPLWVVAERQTAGRGRLERSWVSEPGNLYCSVVTPALPSGVAPSALSFAAALAVSDTVAIFAEGQDVAVKWPNDILLGGRKVSGILLENLGEAIVCGIGINIAHSPDTDRWPATHLGAGGTAPAVDEVLAALQAHFAQWRERLASGGLEALRGEWTARAHGVETEIVVKTGGRVLAGRFQGLGRNGELMLATRAGTVPVVAGDVTYRGTWHTAPVGKV